MRIQEKIITVYCGYTTIDEYGRRGALIGVYRNREDANLGVSNQGWYGGPGDVVEKKAIQDGDDIYPLEVTRPWCFKDVEELREQRRKELLDAALAKLTPMELLLIKESVK